MAIPTRYGLVRQGSRADNIEQIAVSQIEHHPRHDLVSVASETALVSQGVRVED